MSVGNFLANYGIQARAVDDLNTRERQNKAFDENQSYLKKQRGWQEEDRGYQTELRNRDRSRHGIEAKQMAQADEDAQRERDWQTENRDLFSKGADARVMAEAANKRGDFKSFDTFKTFLDKAKTEGLYGVIMATVDDNVTSDVLVKANNVSGNEKVDRFDIEQVKDPATGKIIDLKLTPYIKGERQPTQSRNTLAQMLGLNKKTLHNVPEGGVVVDDRGNKVYENVKPLVLKEGERVADPANPNAGGGGVTKESTDRMGNWLVKGKGPFQDMSPEEQERVQQGILGGQALLSAGAIDHDGKPMTPERAAAVGRDIHDGKMTKPQAVAAYLKNAKRGGTGATPGGAAAPTGQSVTDSKTGKTYPVEIINGQSVYKKEDNRYYRAAPQSAGPAAPAAHEVRAAPGLNVPEGEPLAPPSATPGLDLAPSIEDEADRQSRIAREARTRTLQPNTIPTPAAPGINVVSPAAAASPVAPAAPAVPAPVTSAYARASEEELMRRYQGARAAAGQASLDPALRRKNEQEAAAIEAEVQRRGGSIADLAARDKARQQQTDVALETKLRQQQPGGRGASGLTVPPVVAAAPKPGIEPVAYDVPKTTSAPVPPKSAKTLQGEIKNSQGKLDQNYRQTEAAKKAGKTDEAARLRDERKKMIGSHNEAVKATPPKAGGLKQLSKMSKDELRTERKAVEDLARKTSGEAQAAAGAKDGKRQQNAERRNKEAMTRLRAIEKELRIRTYTSH